MSYCMNCGKMIPDNEPYCQNCGTKNQEYKASPQPKPEQTPPPSSPQPKWTPPQPGSSGGSQPSAVAMERTEYASGEQVVRSYHCTSLKSPSCEGFLTVTNKRVIFHGVGGSSRINQECWLDGVSGIDSYYGKNTDKGKIIRGIIVAVFGLLVLMTGANIGGTAMLVGLGILAIGAYMIFNASQSCFVLEIYSSKASGKSISLGNGPAGLTGGNTALYTLTGLPTSETDKMLDEIGAMVLDLQTLGDRAIQKWKK